MSATSLLLDLGARVVIPGLWGSELIRIDQKQFDAFQLVFDEDEPGMLIDLDTRGDNRHPEEGPLLGEPPRPAPIMDLDGIRLETGDLLRVPGLGTKQIWSIQEIREGRFQVHLSEKYQHDVVIDVVLRDSSR